MSADTIKELHIQRDKWIEAAIKQQSRAKRAEASLASSHEEIARLREALEEFGTSRVRDRVAARVGCNHDILHDALQQEVARALASKAGAA